MTDIEDLGKVFLQQDIIVVNGLPRKVKVDPSTSLANWLRESCGLTGTKIGCGSKACGACTVMVSYREGDEVRHVSVNSCSTPVGPLVNLHVTTAEADDQLLKDIQRRFACGHASQCGFCTPGFTCKVNGILRQNPAVDLTTAQKELDGNLCRCTGYRPILSAVNSLFQPAKLPHTSGDLIATSSLGLTDFQPLETLPPFAFEECLQHPSSSVLKAGDSQFFRPSSLGALCQALDAKPGAILLGGLTGVHTQPGKTYISAAYVPELRRINAENGALALGSAVTFQETIDFLIKHPDEEKFSLFTALQQMLHDVGSSAIRASATWGGCVALNEDNSDVLCFLTVTEATIDVRSPSGAQTVPAEKLLEHSLPPTDLVLAVRIPAARPNTLYLSLKSKPRPDFSRPIVGGTFAVTLDGSGQPEWLSTSLVGLSQARTHHCFDSGQLHNGHVVAWSESGPTLHNLSRQFFHPLIDRSPHPVFSASYRKDLADALMLDFVAFTSLTRTPLQWKPMIDTTQSFQLLQSESPVGQPVPLATAFLQASGKAEYTDDEAAKAHALFCAPILSQRSHAKFKIDDAAARQLPGVLAIYYARDARGNINNEASGPLMAAEETTFFGQVLGLVVASDYDTAQRASYAVKVSYEELPAVSSIEQAIAEKSFYQTDFAGPFEQGDVEAALAGCDEIVEGVVNLAAAEHWYLEPHSSLAVPREDGTEVSVLAATQHQAGLFGQVAALTGLSHARVHVRTTRLGGGFGGKSAPALALPALPAVLLQQPCRLTLNRTQDVLLTTKRAQQRVEFKVGLKNKRMHALHVHAYHAGGWYHNDATYVPYLTTAGGMASYEIPNVRLQTTALRLNRAPVGPFRGAGIPQGVAVLERVTEQAARRLGVDPDQFRQDHIRSAPSRWLGVEMDSVYQRAVWDEAMAMSEFAKRKVEVAEFNRTHHARRRGLAIQALAQPVAYGKFASMRPFHVARATVHVAADGSVLIAHKGIEMGQGLNQKMVQIVSHQLSIPAGLITVAAPSSQALGHTATETGGSVGSELNSAALIECCRKIKKRMAEVCRLKKWDAEKATHFELAAGAAEVRVALSAFANVGWDGADNSLMKYFVWGAAVVEAEVDLLTGEYYFPHASVCLEVGRSLNSALDIGQLEGGFVQGLSWITREEILYDPAGRMLNPQPGKYYIATGGSIPRTFNAKLLPNTQNLANKDAAYASKGIGEPPYSLSAAAWVALQRAVAAAPSSSSFSWLDIPATHQRVRAALAPREEPTN